jgi:hypothetical protein
MQGKYINFLCEKGRYIKRAAAGGVRRDERVIKRTFFAHEDKCDKIKLFIKLAFHC